MSIQQAASHIQNAKRLVILTGAGVSKESGVPTFRDAMDGLWAKKNGASGAIMPALLEAIR